MKVLVTGATGFVGSHTAAAFAAAGHDVRVLVRNPDRLSAALGPHGLEAEVIVGDMTDADAVRTAVEGCGAVVHAAAQVGVGGGGPAGEANLVGVRTVIGSAIEAGVGRILYTSSSTVHVPCATPTITLDSPLAESTSDYAVTKIEAERLVQRWQHDGHPITSVVLGGVYGPQAPDLINSFTAILSAVDTFMVVPPGGTTVIDVRDVARLLVQIAQSDLRVPRVLAGGHYLTWAEWVVALEKGLGRPIASQQISAEELLDLARALTDAATGDEPPALNEEAARVMLDGVPVDDVAGLAEFDVVLRPVEDTFADAVAYLRAIGRLAPDLGSADMDPKAIK